MSAARVWAVFAKDAVDALRDARILVALVIPIGLAVFYGQAFGDDPGRVRATVAVAGETVLAERLATSDAAAEVRVRRVAADEARRLVAEDEADVGLVVPAAFDEAVRAGRSPDLAVLLDSDGMSGPAALVQARLDGALAALAGQRPPVVVRAESVQGGDDGSVLDRIEISRYFVLVSVAILISFIAFLVVPVILSEEIERKTLDALLLAARPSEILIAKALVGLLYTVVAVPLTLLLTGLGPEDPLRFGVGAVGLAVGLIGFGLLFALALRSANRVNTWSGIAVMVVSIPVFLVGAPLSDPVGAVVAATPTGAGTRLMMDGLQGEALFGASAASLGVLVAWAAVGYLVLVRTLARRDL